VSDAQRQRIREDLRGNFRGELHLDPVARSLYSTDASLFQIEPLAVAVPIDEEDLQTVVRYANEQHLPIIPRGAGTGLSGESLGDGIIVDLSVYFRSIIEMNSDTVRVQPGVVLAHLNNELAKVGRRFAPDPASGGVCTIGGMLATNASGSRSFRFGYTRDHVSEVRVVWDNGDADDVGREPCVTADEVLPWIASSTIDASYPRTRTITRSVSNLISANRELIENTQPRTPFNRCGYLLHDVLDHDHLELAKLLIGTEGTLALFTEATLQTVPLPGGRSVILLAFPDLDSAIAAAELARDRHAVASELLDRRLLALSRTHASETMRLVPSSAETLLLVEFEEDSSRLAGERAIDLIHAAQSLPVPPVMVQSATEPSEIDRLWQLRESILPGLYAFGRGPRPLAFIEDVAVPIEEMPRFLTHIQDLLQRFETTASFLIHALTGQIHIRPFLDLSSPTDAAKLWPMAQRVYEQVLSIGGTVSSQHGTGLSRTPWVAEQYGKLFPVFRELKNIFDPHNLLNPGKIVGPDPSRPSWPLRSSPPIPERIELPSILNWGPDELSTEVNRCNGCGDCRTESIVERMCPMFRVKPDEAATPRAKANMLRQMLATPELFPSWTDNSVREVAELCINCRMCASECSAKVNIPKLMIETKAAHQAKHGLERSDWVLARMEHFAAFSSNFALVANQLIKNKPIRWLMEKLFGVSRHRTLPPFAERNFLRRARRYGWTRKPRTRSFDDQSLEQHLESLMLDAEARVSDLEGEFDRRRRGEVGPIVRPITQKVAYFVDVFANYNDPGIAIATVKVLRHHGIDVYVPSQQKSCGMAPYAQGDIDTAREIALHNIRIFADLVREGYRIVCSEPTAALMLRHDYLDLFDDPDAVLVAENTIELTAFLHELQQEGRLRTDFRSLDLSLGHHIPCHLKALRGPLAGSELLALIPGVRVFTIDVSCSGMAGTFGLKAENYQTSLEAGRPMLDEMRRPRVLHGATECSACRMQMEEGSGKRTLHPIQYLALAYGLMPELGRLLRRPLS